jgi:hypothetical protein
MKFIKTTLLLFVVLSVFAQKDPKIDFDDDIITIDKVKKYDFITTKKGGFTSLSAAVIKNLEGKELFIIKDTILYLSKLDHEKEKKREFTEAHIFIAPMLNKMVFIEPIKLTSIRKTLFKDLKKTTFFGSEGQDSTWFNAMAEEYGAKTMQLKLKEYEEINVKRQVNTQKSIEIFGPMFERKPAAIQSSTFSGMQMLDGAKRIAEMERVTGGSYSTEYRIVNKNNKVIASFYHQPSESAGNVMTHVDKIRKNFYFDRTDNMDIILTKLCEYLIFYGYM